MAADMCNYVADTTAKHEADIQSTFKDFSSSSLRVALPAGAPNLAAEPALAPAPAPPKTLPKLKFSFGKKK